MRLVLAAIIPVLLLFQHVWGQQEKSLGFYFDNDLLYFPLNEDRDYTFGMGVFFAGGKGRGNPAGYLLNLADKATGVRRWQRSAPLTVFSSQVDLRLYTPDNLRATRILYRDRPYASVLSVTAVKTSFFPARGIQVQTAFELGTLGLFLAREVQSGAHALSRSVTGKEYPYAPMGWGNQISAGGEPVIRYAVKAEKKILPLVWRSQYKPGREHFSLALHAGAEAGYLSSLFSGVSTHIGWINARGYSGKHEWYFRLGYQFRMHLYNALLQGQFRPSVHTIGYDNLHLQVRQGEAGFTWRYKRFSTGYTLYYRSAEIRNTLYPHHYYGQWIMTYQL